jgi:hypothetical protein
MVENVPNRTTWIGDAWILPPHQRLFAPFEIRDYFRRHHVLFVGDFEATRIHYGTLVELLQDTTNHPSRNRLGNSTLLDRTYVANGSSCDSYFSIKRTICRTFSNHRLDFIEIECFLQVSAFLSNHELIQRYHVIILATGRLETAVKHQRRKCETRHSRDFPGGAFARFKTLTQDLKKIEGPPVIFWRTGAFSRQEQHDYVENMDELARIHLRDRSNIQLIDYAEAIRERVYNRIPSERALLFIQLLMNAVSGS